MATILRKIINRASNRRSSTPMSSLDSLRYAATEPSLGAFEEIPEDVLIQILKLLGPKGATKMILVCKSWKPLVSDDRLWIYFFQNQMAEHWESVLFTETHLRFGYPIRASSVEVPQLSFIRVYRHSTQAPVSVIIDGGSGCYKFGWSKYDSPSGRAATFQEFGNIESSLRPRLVHFFTAIYSRMGVNPSLQPIVLTIPLCHYDDTESAKASRRQLKETIFSVLFEMKVPAICPVNQATLALYAARQTSGIVVNIGFQVTSVVPVLNGKVMHKVGVEVIGMGGLKVTSFLVELLKQNNISFKSLDTVRTLKEKLCYVASDYDAELRRDTKASYQVPGEGWFTLSKERFQTGEVLFQPHLAGERMMGLHRAVALCVDHCHTSQLTPDDSWFKTVVLCGGTACLPGLPGRLERELQSYLSPSIANGIRVIPPPYGADTAWVGAKLISNLSTFPGSWCVTRKQLQSKRRFNLKSKKVAVK